MDQNNTLLSIQIPMDSLLLDYFNISLEDLLQFRFKREREEIESLKGRGEEYQIKAEVEETCKYLNKNAESCEEFCRYSIDLIANRELLGPILENLRCFFCKKIVRIPKSCYICRQLYCKQCVNGFVKRHSEIPCIAQRNGNVCHVVEV